MHASPTSDGKSRRARLAALGLAAAATLTIALVMAPKPASAHCDSVNGPVATAARAALDEGDVALVLPYVKANQEEELAAAFEQAVAVRSRGREVREVADRYFQETAVRLHRVGEGASYTGITDQTEADPRLEAAEAALERGSADEVVALLDRELAARVDERLQAVLVARAAEEANPGVAAARERVEAELAFERYVVGIGAAIDAEASHEATDPAAHTG